MYHTAIFSCFIINYSVFRHPSLFKRGNEGEFLISKRDYFILTATFDTAPTEKINNSISKITYVVRQLIARRIINSRKFRGCG